MATLKDQLTDEQQRALAAAQRQLAAREADIARSPSPLEQTVAGANTGDEAGNIEIGQTIADHDRETANALKALALAAQGQTATKAEGKPDPDSLELSVQKRAAPQQVPGASVATWWFVQDDSGEIGQWWSEQRDRDLRDFWMREGNDILQGAVTSMVKKFKAMNWTLEGPDATVKRMQDVLGNAEFGQGWGNLIGKTITDWLTQDKGAFWELIGEGDPNGPLEGLPVGVAHLDSGQCQLTGDPVYPVLYRNPKTKYCPKCSRKFETPNITQCPFDQTPLEQMTHRMHATRVVHLVDMPSPNESMKNIGFCSVSRVIASSYVLLKLAQYKNEKLSDLPQAGLLLLNNILPSQWEDAQAGHEKDRRRLGQQLWSNVMVLMGLDPEKPVSADFLNFAQLPDQFNEKEATELYINIVALSFGVDVREFWPLSAGPLGTATETLVMHQKAKGKGVGELISTIERAINWYILPKRVEFKFDFADDEEDQARAILDETKAKTILSMFLPSPDGSETIASRDEVRQMLADHVSYFVPQFLEADMTGSVQADDTDPGTTGDEAAPQGRKPKEPAELTEAEAEKLFGRTVVMDRKGRLSLPHRVRKKPWIDGEWEMGAKQNEETPPVVSDKVQPAGQPLDPWGDREVEISPEDIAAAIREWDERVPEAAGVLTAGERG